MSAKLLSIIGPVAVGKTTLAESLSLLLPARILREDYEGNPFLAKSFRDDEALFLPSQLYFLFTRVKQLAADAWPAEGLVVADYGFCQDQLYARIKLRGSDLDMYQNIRRQVEPLVTPPSVVIHLDAPVEMLQQRIRKRGRGFESAYSAEYLTQLRQAQYDVVLPEGCRKIFIDCETVDLLDAKQREKIVAQIREAMV